MSYRWPVSNSSANALSSTSANQSHTTRHTSSAVNNFGMSRNQPRKLSPNVLSNSPTIDRAKLANVICGGIKKLRGTELTFDEIKYIMNKTATLDPVIFKHRKLMEVIDVLIKVYAEELKVIIKTEDNLEIHEILNKEIGTEAESGTLDKKLEPSVTLDSLLQTPAILQHIINPQALERKAYIILDRRYQSHEANNTDTFKWNLSHIGAAYDPLTTAVTTSPVLDIIKIRVFPFNFPNTEHAIGGSSRLSIEILELANQAMVAAAFNKRFHFLLAIERTGPIGSNDRFITNDVGNSDADFELPSPVLHLDSITLRFGNPFYTLQLDPDMLFGVLTPLGAQTVITFTQPHLCVVNDIVYVQNFNTTNPSADASIIDQMNDLSGWYIAVATASTITIDVSMIGMVGSQVGSPYKIYLGAKRFVIKMEFTYMSPTN